MADNSPDRQVYMVSLCNLDDDEPGPEYDNELLTDVSTDKPITDAPRMRMRSIEGCHTLKYLILGCECLLGCVHLLVGFSQNFKDFSGNYSIYSRARSFFYSLLILFL
jgi:hypothetical protein